MRNKVYLIGLNLYSIFLALKIIKDFPHHSVIILEGSNSFLKAFDPIKIGKYNCNPGFHAFENPRSKNVLGFLKKIIKFKIFTKVRGIIVGGYLFRYDDNYKFWPLKLKEKFKLSFKQKKYNFNSIKLNKKNNYYLRYIKNNIYQKDIELKKCIGSLYPWFFPPNYKFPSRDEGKIFQENIRSKKIKHSFTLPESGLFNSISKALHKLIVKKNIRVILNQKISFYKKNKKLYFNHDFLNQKKDIKIICVPVIPLLNSIENSKIISKVIKKFKPKKIYTGLVEIKEMNNKNFSNYMETIVSSEKARGLTRISNYSLGKNIKKNIFQIEFIENDHYKSLDEQALSIVNLLNSFFYSDKNKSKNVNLIGYKFIRNIFFPDLKLIDKLSNFSKNYFNIRKDNILFPRQITWPININKHFLFSNIDYNKQIKKILKKI